MELSYRLIRNADGLTTIKLIRYSDSNENAVPGTAISNASRSSNNNIGSKIDGSNGEMQQQQQEQESSLPTPMESETSSSLDNSPASCDNNLPTDLRK